VTAPTSFTGSEKNGPGELRLPGLLSLRFPKRIGEDKGDPPHNLASSTDAGRPGPGEDGYFFRL
jgi:hypothetical protein